MGWPVLFSDGSSSWLTVIPSTPGAPLLALTRRNAAFQVLSVQRSPPVIRSVLAGLRAHSSSSTIRLFLPPLWASPVGEEEKSKIALDVLPHVVAELMFLLAFLSFGPSTTVPGSAYSVDSAFRLWSASLAWPTSWHTCPLLNSAPRSGCLAAYSSRRSDHEADLPG